MESNRSISFFTIRIPLPPPPPEALMMSGNVIDLAISRILSGFFGRAPTNPGTQGTPASDIVFFAWILSPMVFITEGGGPTKVKPLLTTCSAKSAFSDKNP